MDGFDVVSLIEVITRTPDLSPQDQGALHAEINAAIRRVAPCFAGEVTPDQQAEARGIALRAIARSGAVDAWVESVTSGPFSTKFRASAGSASILTRDDVSALKGLCGAASGDLGPLGSFPEAGSYDRLFSAPRGTT